MPIMHQEEQFFAGQLQKEKKSLLCTDNKTYQTEKKEQHKPKFRLDLPAFSIKGKRDCDSILCPVNSATCLYSDNFPEK